MAYVEKYNKVFYLTDDERTELTKFLRYEFGTTDITDVKIYLNNGAVVCEIQGLVRDENGKFVIGGKN